MPTVPGADSFQTVSPTAPGAPIQQANYKEMMSDVNQNAQEGAKLGNTLQGIGNGLGQQALATQVMTNESDSKTTFAKTVGTVDAVKFDPDHGVMNMQGDKAVKAAPAAISTIQAMPETVLASMANDNQRDMIRPLLMQMVNDSVAQINRHVGQQSVVANTAASDLLGTKSGENYKNSWSPILDGSKTTTPSATPTAPAPATEGTTLATPDTATSTVSATGTTASVSTVKTPAQNALDMVVAQGNELASIKGIPEDARGEFVKEFVAQKAYAPLLDKLLSATTGGDASSLTIAKGFYASVKDALPANMQSQVEKQIELAEGSTTALSTAFTAMQLHPGNIDAQAGYLQKQFQAGAINKTTYDAALSEASQRYSLHNAQVNESTKSVLGNIWGQIQDAKKNGTVFTENMIPPGTLAFIKSQNLGPNVDSMFNRSEGTDNPKMFMDLMTMSQEHPAQFMAMGSGGIAKLQGSLSGQNFNALVNTYNGINNKDVQQQTTDKLMFTTLKYAAAQIDPAAKAAGAGFMTDPKQGSPEAQQLAVFQVQLLQNLRAAAERNKAPLNNDQAKEIALGMLKDQALAGTGYFGSPMGISHTTPFQMTPAQRAADWEIPAADGAAILKSYQSTHGGKSPSNAEMQQRYKMRQGIYQ